MENKKSRLDLLRDRVEDLTIASRRYQSLLYFAWFIFVVLSYGAMVGLNIFVSDKIDVTSTKIQSELSFGNTTYVLVDRQVNLEQRSATFLLGKKESDTVYEDRTWHVSTEYQNGSGDEHIQTTILQGENGFTYIQLEGLASEWSALRVELATKTDDQLEEQQDYIVMGETDLQQNRIAFKSETDVQILSIDYAIEQRNNAITANEKSIKETEDQIEKNKEKVQQLEADMVYQTETQKIETQNSINQLEEQNRQLEGTNYSTGKQNEELEEQIQKLREKQNVLNENR